MLNLAKEIRDLIEQSRQNVALAINSELTLLYWKIGKKINTEVLKEKRAYYGRQIITTLSNELTIEYGRGWSEK